MYVALLLYQSYTYLYWLSCMQNVTYVCMYHNNIYYVIINNETEFVPMSQVCVDI